MSLPVTSCVTLSSMLQHQCLKFGTKVVSGMLQVRLVDPVLAADGYTYEREAITSWLQSQTRSPVNMCAFSHSWSCKGS